jgi:hypothetical protein
VELAKEETVEEEAKTLQIIPINATPTIQTTRDIQVPTKAAQIRDP